MSNNHRYTPAQINFLKTNVKGRTYADLAIMFNKKFGTNLTDKKVSQVVFYHNLLKGASKVRRYTPEEIAFIKKNVFGRSHAELTVLFNERFSPPMTIDKMKSFLANHKLNTGRTGYFTKGHVPFNKGRKGVCYSGCEVSWFKKGQVSINYRPVGSERINIWGYAEIKVADPNKWKSKHSALWEEAHGKIPKGHIVIFLDGNKKNFALDNLMMLSRPEHAVMCHLNWYTNDADTTKANIAMVKIKVSIENLKRKSFTASKNTKMVFLDDNGKRIVVAQVNNKKLYVPARETKDGLRRIKGKIKARRSLKEAQRDLYEYAQQRGWQRI